ESARLGDGALLLRNVFPGRSLRHLDHRRSERSLRQGSDVSRRGFNLGAVQSRRLTESFLRRAYGLVGADVRSVRRRVDDQKRCGEVTEANGRAGGQMIGTVSRA